jgi:diacylglycerol kinase (ATP)
MVDVDTQQKDYMSQYQERAKGLRRLLLATRNSWAGLKTAFVNEAAFRQEIILSLFLIPITLILPISVLFKVYLFCSIVIILVSELLNSSIEVIVDALSPEYNLWAKQAKDLGSAAVFLSLINSFISFLAAIATAFL